jgi:hypothetical protein
MRPAGLNWAELRIYLDFWSEFYGYGESEV